jgi:hypothetical protein
MTSVKQIEANRRNAWKSTGPKTEAGKLRSRRNALRHGLTAETVIHLLEDADDYRAFEEAVTNDFDVQTAVERELVLRLASLLWRLRRAVTVESGLIEGQKATTRDYRGMDSIGKPTVETKGGKGTQVESQPFDITPTAEWNSGGQDQYQMRESTTDARTQCNPNSEIARYFLEFINLEDGAFERLGRYETALWRQVYQVIFTLEVLRRQTLDLRWLPKLSRRGGAPFYPSRS